MYRGRRIEWNPVQGSSLVAGRGGGVHLAFAATSSAGRGELVHLALPPAAEPAGIVPLAAAPVYVHLAAGDGGRMALAYAASHRDGEGSHPNTIFVVRSGDGGKTWSAPLRVSRPAQGPAYEPRLLFAGGDTLHLLWTQHAGEADTAPRAVWHSASPDGGRTWDAGTPTPVSGMPNQSQAALDRCGAVHLLHADFSQVALVHSTFSQGRWTAPRRPFAGMGADPVLRADDRGTLHLVWSEIEVRNANDAEGLSRLVYSTLDGCAAAPG